MIDLSTVEAGTRVTLRSGMSATIIAIKKTGINSYRVIFSEYVSGKSGVIYDYMSRTSVWSYKRDGCFINEYSDRQAGADIVSINSFREFVKKHDL